MNKTTGKKYGKLALDLILLVLLSLMYRKQVISMDFHETGGLILCGLFLLHKALNWQWICAVTAGIFRRRVKFNIRWLVDVLLLLSMTAVAVTGLLIAKTLPTAVDGAYWLKPWHYFFAALSLGLSGVHLGLHAGLLYAALWSKLPIADRTRKAAGALLLCAVLCFGTYSLVSTGFLSQLSQPIVASSMSAGGGQRPLPGEASQHSGEGRPGAGKGKGQGQGKGIGKGNGQNGEHGSVGAVPLSRVLQTVASYSSILLWFAAVTGILESMVRRRGKQQALPGSNRSDQTEAT